MPDELTGGPAPARRRRGLPSGASALVVIAFTLLVVSGVVYVQSIPSLLAADDQSASTAEKGEDPAEADQSQSGAAGDAAAPGSQAAPATEKDASAEKSPQPEKVKLPDVSLEGAHVEEKPSSPDTEDPKPDAPAADRPKPPTDDAPAGDTDDDTPDDDAGDDVLTSTPSAEEEAAFRAPHPRGGGRVPCVSRREGLRDPGLREPGQRVHEHVRERLPEREPLRPPRQPGLLCRSHAAAFFGIHRRTRLRAFQQLSVLRRTGASNWRLPLLDELRGLLSRRLDRQRGLRRPPRPRSRVHRPLAACDGYLAEFHSYYDGLAL